KFELFDTYDIQLIMNGLEIQKKRKDAVFQFNQIFEKMYENISGISGVNIRYLPSWKNPDEVSLPNIDEIMETVKSKREIERALGTTVTGPHRDKIVFEKNGGSFVPKASTGQRRLIALILRTAQAVFYTQVTSKKPVLLMDDVMLELDPEKRRKLTALLPDYDQLFCTFLPGEPYENYMHESTRVYKIEKGAWTECK
ncbi:MAG: DNA replication/repair protein RecF, partial [Treponema sp.]|nr:DNA replication/repair protein RecF [Treponema sp.]